MLIIGDGFEIVGCVIFNAIIMQRLPTRCPQGLTENYIQSALLRTLQTSGSNFSRLEVQLTLEQCGVGVQSEIHL